MVKWDPSRNLGRKISVSLKRNCNAVLGRTVYSSWHVKLTDWGMIQSWLVVIDSGQAVNITTFQSEGAGFVSWYRPLTCAFGSLQLAAAPFPTMVCLTLTLEIEKAWLAHASQMSDYVQATAVSSTWWAFAWQTLSPNYHESLITVS